MSYYRTCLDCGSHLDHGEICDCKKDAALRATTSEDGENQKDTFIMKG